MKQYYIRPHSENEGPFTLEELEVKKIFRETPVWSEGMPNWQIAGNVVELQFLFTAEPPPFQSTYLPLAFKEIEEPKSSIWKKVFIGIGILLITYLGLIGFSSFDKSEPETYQEKVMTIAEMEVASPVSYLEVDGSYRKNFWGTKFILEGNIQNNATVVTYKDVVLIVKFYSNTNSVIKTEYHTLYKYFSPNSTQPFSFKLKSVKDAVSVGLEISDAKNK